MLRENAAAIIAGISVGTLVSLGSALALALALDLTQEQYATLLPKSVTNRTIKTAFRAGWMLDYPSAEDYLNPLYASSSADGHGSNDGDYKSAEFDKLLNAALAQTDVKKRTEDFTKAQEVLAKDLPVIPLWNDNVAAASATNVKNVSFDYLLQDHRRRHADLQ